MGLELVRSISARDPRQLEMFTRAEMVGDRRLPWGGVTPRLLTRGAKCVSLGALPAGGLRDRRHPRYR